MKKLALILLLSSLIFLNKQSALAHVLITDDSKSIGAVLHIQPDDDPIAGKQASLFLDIQSGFATDQTENVILVITDSSGNSEQVKTTTEGGKTFSEYNFPSQGTYKLKYTVETPGKQYTFSHTQRVSRGLSDEITQNNSDWARATLIFSVVSLLTLLVVAISRRKSISSYSKF